MTPTIKFSHRYKKMPLGVEHLDTWINDIALIDFKNLTLEQIKQDTETVDGQFYELPKTKLICIKLWTVTINGAHIWATMRRWTPEKEIYYRGLKGKEVNIVIEEKK